MTRIKMPAARSKAQEITFEEAFIIFLTDSAARGLAEKTLKTYRNHLHCISLYFDISTPLGKLSRNKMNEMVVAMRESGLATNSISSYVRVTTTFLNWCKYKFAQYENGEFELTDRINDPEENVNLVHNGQNPELLAEYRNKLLMMVLKTGSRFPEQFCHA